MILIGQYDSPFVRRVGIALTLYEMSFEHRPWSVFGDAAKIQPINPLTRVPTLVLDDGTALVDSASMLDYLDGQVPEARALFPRREPARHLALRVAALGAGLADKAVSLFYELRLHGAAEVSKAWSERCREQVLATARRLEAESAAIASPYWFGEAIGHADIMIAAAWRFIAEVHAGLLTEAQFPALARHAARCEALEAFRKIQQPYKAPV